jgi:hypothetical protein
MGFNLYKAILYAIKNEKELIEVKNQMISNSNFSQQINNIMDIDDTRGLVVANPDNLSLIYTKLQEYSSINTPEYLIGKLNY